MKKSIISESQIVAAIKEQESAKKVADISLGLGGTPEQPFIIRRKSIKEWTTKSYAV